MPSHSLLFLTVSGALALASCSAGKGSYAAPAPTPTFLSGTPGTVARVTPSTGSSSSEPVAAGTPVPVVQAGTPIPLNTAGTHTPPSTTAVPTVIAPAKSQTPLPGGCGATDTSGTPSPNSSSAAAATPAASAAPGPYKENGTVTIVGGLSVPIDANNASFQPNTIVVKPGVHVRLDINNGAGITHDFCSPALGIDYPIRIDAPRVAEQTLIAVVEFTAPTQPGTYMFWSNVEGQVQRGMTGAVIVKP